METAICIYTYIYIEVYVRYFPLTMPGGSKRLDSPGTFCEGNNRKK